MSRAPWGTSVPSTCLDGLAQHPGQRHAPALHPQQDQVVDALVGLDDLVGHALDGPVHLAGVHDHGFFGEIHGASFMTDSWLGWQAKKSMAVTVMHVFAKGLLHGSCDLLRRNLATGPGAQQGDSGTKRSELLVKAILSADFQDGIRS